MTRIAPYLFLAVIAVGPSRCGGPPPSSGAQRELNGAASDPITGDQSGGDNRKMPQTSSATDAVRSRGILRKGAHASEIIIIGDGGGGVRNPNGSTGPDGGSDDSTGE